MTIRNLEKGEINQSTTIESEIFNAVTLEEAWSFVYNSRTMEIELLRAAWAPENTREMKFKLKLREMKQESSAREAYDWKWGHCREQASESGELDGREREATGGETGGDTRQVIFG